MSESGSGGTGARPREERVQTGIPRLDFILKGGFKSGGTYAVMGPPGGGKTIFANQVCCNHIEMKGGRCVYMTLLIETHAKMVAHLSSLSFFKPEYMPDRICYVSGYQVVREAFDQPLDAMAATRTPAHPWPTSRVAPSSAADR